MKYKSNQTQKYLNKYFMNHYDHDLNSQAFCNFMIENQLIYSVHLL